MAAALSARRPLPRAARPPPGRGRLVVPARAARRRLLVPAQPDRRRQPAAARSTTSARSRCRIPSACRAAGPTSASPTTRPTPASGATTSRPACTTAFGALWPLVVARSGRSAACWRCSAAATGSCAGSAAWRSSASSPISSRRSAPPAPRAPRPASRSTSATSSRRCSLGAGAAAPAAPPRRPPAPVGRCWAACSLVLVLTDRSDAALRDPLALFAAGPGDPRRHRPGRLCWRSGPRRAAAALAGRLRGGSRSLVARDRLPGPAPLPQRPLPNEGPRTDPRHGPRLGLPLGPRRRATPASASPAPPPASSSTASTAPTSPTASSTSAKRARTAPSTRSRPAPAFRAAVNDADLDYLVTSPFLNFVHTGSPISSPEAGWLRGESAVRPVQRSGPITSGRSKDSSTRAPAGAAQRPAAAHADSQPERRWSRSSESSDSASGSGGRGAADHDLVGVDAHRDLALARPMLGVDRVVLDRGVEPEAVAVGLAVVEGRLELFAAPAAAAAPAAPAPFRPLAVASAASSTSSSSSPPRRSRPPRPPRPLASSAVAASISASISSRRSSSLGARPPRRG